MACRLHNAVEYFWLEYLCRIGDLTLTLLAFPTCRYDCIDKYAEENGLDK